MISSEYRNEIKKVGERNPWTPKTINNLKVRLNNDIANNTIYDESGIPDYSKINPDRLEMAKFLNNADASALDFMAQGATFGFSEEVKGFLSTMPTDFAIAVERSAMEKYQDMNPIKAAGAEVAGAVLPSFFSRGKKIPTLTDKSTTTVGKVIARTKKAFDPSLSTATRSGVYGTAYGVGKSEGTAKERLGKWQPYVNGLASALLSYPIRVLSRGAGAIIDTFAEMPSAEKGKELAIKEVREALIQDHGSIEEALAMIKNTMGTGKQITPADLGPNSRATLEMVNLIPGPGKKQATQFLLDRASGRRGRIVSDLQEAFGTDADYYTSFKAIEDAKKRLGSERYNAAFNMVMEDGTTEPQRLNMNQEFLMETVGQNGEIERKFFTMNELVSRPSLKKAMPRAIEIASEEGVDLPLIEITKDGLAYLEGENKGKLVDDIDFEFAHYLKLAMDDLISNANNPLRSETSMGPTQVNKMMGTKKMFLTALDTNEEYKLARDTFAGFSAIQDAMDMGKDIFGKKSMNPEEAMAMMGKGEQEAYRLGVFQALFDKVDAGSDSRDLAKLIFNNERNRRLVRATFPNNEQGEKMFVTFFDNIGREMDTRATEIKVNGGSATAERAIKYQNFKENAIRQIRQNELTPLNIVNEALSQDFEELTTEQMSAASEKIADILTEQEFDEFVKKLNNNKTFIEAFNEINPFKIPKMLKAITSFPDSPYVLGDVVSQISDAVDEEMDIEKLPPAIIERAKQFIQDDKGRGDSLSRLDNFRMRAPEVADDVLPAERAALGDQLNEMLASFQPSDMPIVPPVTAIRPQDMINETVLPNPRDREIAERQMQGIGSLV